ncbi:hypothetical protein KP509_21G043300 [Ceratopteris richardii]|uniref:Uncharacterized protein n=1 Tax=Ceratopteris richardii TaxID=49495 RepID=A0A8T2SBA2_CERRI|nr:hypothetical protein KP509_21G043300 [Ceratopteris richardii]
MHVWRLSSLMRFFSCDNDALLDLLTVKCRVFLSRQVTHDVLHASAPPLSGTTSAPMDIAKGYALSSFFREQTRSKEASLPFCLFHTSIEWNTEAGRMLYFCWFPNIIGTLKKYSTVLIPLILVLPHVQMICAILIMKLNSVLDIRLLAVECNFVIIAFRR